VPHYGASLIRRFDYPPDRPGSPRMRCRAEGHR